MIRGPLVVGRPNNHQPLTGDNQRVVKFESLDPEIRGVLGKKVSELGLKVEGSPVEGYVSELYKELERRGLKKFRPVCYLTDEWGCPDRQPVLQLEPDPLFVLEDGGPGERALVDDVGFGAHEGGR